MAIATREFDYEVNGTTFDGAVALDDAQAGPRPAVMVCHGLEGRSDAQVECARSLARLGYVGFACDMFGKGIRGDVTGDNSARIAPFLRDRPMLRTRLVGTVKVVQSLPEVDPNKVAAIGFCFGGLCVLDLARSSAPTSPRPASSTTSAQPGARGPRSWRFWPKRSATDWACARATVAQHRRKMAPEPDRTASRCGRWLPHAGSRTAGLVLVLCCAVAPTDCRRTSRQLA